MTPQNRVTRRKGARTTLDDAHQAGAPNQIIHPAAGALAADSDLLALSADQRLIQIADKQLDAITAAEGTLRSDMRKDRLFRLGHIGDEKYQWPADPLQRRIQSQRPALQINRMGVFVDMARGEGDAAQLKIKVNAVDDEADPKTAVTLQGLIRNTEVYSRADDVYEKAADSQCEMGRGYIWVVTEYAGERSFNVRPRLLRVTDPLLVWVDATHREKDASDAEYAFVDYAVDISTWKQRYGQNGTRTPPTPQSAHWIPDANKDVWFPSEHTVLMRHWYRAEYQIDTLYETHDGKTFFEEDVDAHVQRIAADAAREIAERRRARGSAATLDVSDKAFTKAKAAWIATHVVRTRKTERRIIKWRIIDAEYIHSETTWPTPWQPLVPMIGSESHFDGKVDLRGVIRDGKDPQVVYNVMVTTEMEVVSDAPRTPWVGVRGVFGAPKTPQNMAWTTAHVGHHTYLEYELTDVDGTKHDIRPQRNFGETAIAGLVAAIQQADNDLKSTARWNDASLAKRGAQESGVAIGLRQQQDQRANSYLTRNRRSAIASVGRQLIALYRTLYTNAQVVRITGEDDSARKVYVFNGPDTDPRLEPTFTAPKGVSEFVDLSVGEYDAECTAMPTAGARRQQDLELLMGIAKVLPPEAVANSADLLVSLLDSPTGIKLHARLKKMISPEFRDEDEEDGRPQIPPEVRQAVEKMRKQMELMGRALKEADETIKQKRIETASREHIESMKRYIELLTLMVREEAADKRLMLETEAERIYRFMTAQEQRVRALEESDPEMTPAAAPAAPVDPQGDGGEEALS